MLRAKRFFRGSLYVVILLVFMSLSFSIVPIFAQTAPEDVAKAIIAAENSNNVDAAAALFADDAVVTLADGSSYNTPDGVRGWQQSLADGHFHLEPINMQVDGNTVSWTGDIFLDAFRSLGIAAMGGNWTLDIENGKIKTFDFTFTPDALTALTTGSIADALIKAEAAHDVDTAASLFAGDAVVTLADGSVYKTPDDIRAWQQSLADGNFDLEPIGRVVDGMTITWTGTISLDAFRGMGISSLGGDWTLDIDNGKVKTFDFAWTSSGAATLQAAIQAMATPEATASS